jgi:hypothetical protein
MRRRRRVRCSPPSLPRATALQVRAGPGAAESIVRERIR